MKKGSQHAINVPENRNRYETIKITSAMENRITFILFHL
jgi:hypothetical protein